MVKNHRKVMAVVAAVASLAMALGGCGSSSNKGADASAGNTITAMNAEPASGLLPGNTNSTTGGKVLDLIFSQLVAFDSKGKPVNEVAKEIKSNDDATQFTITIKDGWKFTDGTPVTAESFTKAWSYAANVSNAQINANFFSNIKGYDKVQQKGVASDEQLEGLKVVDDHTFTVDLSTSDSNFPIKVGYTGFAPLPESFYKDPKAFGESPVSDGPYKFKSWKHNADIVLEKNPDYNGNFKAANDGLDFKIYTAANASYADIQSGNLDISQNVPTSALKTFTKDPKVNSYSKASSGIAAFTIPSNLEHFGGEEGVLRRQAISMAIDRKQITEKVLSGTATPVTDFAAPTISGHSDKLKGSENLEYNPKKAKELWAKADAISKFTGTFTIAYNTDGGTKPIYDAVVNQLKNNLGIDAATNPVATFQEFRAAITDRTMKSAFRTGWQADYPSIENYLKPIFSSSAADGKGSNDGDYKNPAFDKLLDEAAKASDLDAANKLYQQAEEILLNDLPGIPLYNSNAYAVFGKNVKHAEPNWNGVPVFHELTKQ